MILLQKMVVTSLLLLGLGGCWQAGNWHRAIAQSNPPRTPPMTQPQTQPQTQPVDQRLVSANTRFGLKLFSQLLKENPNQNMFVSPMSVAIALTMTYTGASGETQQEMAQALELQGLSLDEITQAYATLNRNLENVDPKVQLKIANSLWAKQGVNFKPDFLQTNQQFFQAKLTELDFQDPNAPRTINNWVSESTNGKINKIVDQLKADDILFLINAIYFKGSWTEAFERSQTRNRPFYLANNQQKNHPLMNQSGEYRYLENDQFQAISLPYAQGRLSLYVFLPRPNQSLEQFQSQLTAENWQTWMRQFRNRDGSITLPRFKLEYGAELSSALKALGMEKAFAANQADFSAMTQDSAKIDQVQHKTFVEVNEEGTEAAAVTSVGITTTSVSIPSEPFAMVVNRPFFCAIRDNQTGAILFLGTIVNP